MVRAVVVVSRDGAAPNSLDSYADELHHHLAADNIAARPPVLLRGAGVTAALFNSSSTTRTQGASIAVGMLLDPADDWPVPGARLPDGSYALLRTDDTRVELVADGVGSRTLWYALTNRELIASTSQRAIIALLGSFEPNRDVLPWMLSAGTLGPTGGWDARLKRVQPGERVLLDRVRWRLQSVVEPTEVVADAALSHDAHLERLRATLVDACSRWSFDACKWVLTLSGGADSRGLLCLLRDRGVGTVTWGLPHSEEKHGNDAQVAREVAHRLGVSHRFIGIEPGRTDPDVVLGRFLALGEGRVDRISGYVDGFAVWKMLFDEGFNGVIRGDHAFGSQPVRSPYAVRSKTSLTTLDDYFTDDEIESFELPAQRIPEELTRGTNETLAAWCERLYRRSRMPTFLAALTDLKTAYVDVGNPLLARSVLACAYALPGELRSEKRLWKTFVRMQLPEIAMARRVAIPSVTDFLTQRSVLQLMLDELSSARAAMLFSPALRSRCRAALTGALQTKWSPRRIDWGDHPLARAVPRSLRAAVSSLRPNRPSLEPVVLAFRVFIASRMQAMLAADAATLCAGRAAAVQAGGS